MYDMNMTVEKAIAVLNNHRLNECDNQKLISAELEAIQALEKQIPKAIIPRGCLCCALENCDTSCDKDFNRCPNCNEVLDTDSGEEYKHCPDCGQALKWKTEDGFDLRG